MNGGEASNVLWVVLDTVRKDHLTPYGHDRDTTPELAGFADEAAVYDTAIAPAPWTLPVHASMFTGRYPGEHGADQVSPYLDDVATLAGILSAAGYETGCFSSNAWITPYTKLTRGFDQQNSFFEVMPGNVLSGPLASAWKAINDRERLRSLASRVVRAGAKIHAKLASGEGADSKTPAVIDRTQSFVEEAGDADRPWFAFINLMDAHLPYYPPEEYRERFAPGVDPTSVCQNSKEFNSGARAIDEAEWEDIRALYDAEIAHIDAQVGRLFDWLRETDQWEDTTVVVCADHGELLGEHDLYGHEFCVYEELVNVPLLVKHPDLSPGRRDELVELLDLYHTLLDVTGVDDAGLEGVQRPAVGFDPSRSLLSDGYREFAFEDANDPGQRALARHNEARDKASDEAGDEAGDISDELDADSDGDDDDSVTPNEVDDYAFIEYAQPLIELHHLEQKAAEAGIDLPDDHRAYASMRAARGETAKYIEADGIADEGYRLDEDPREQSPVDPDSDDRVGAARDALTHFAEEIGVSLTADEEDTEEGGIGDADEEIQERLRDLGYME